MWMWLSSIGHYLCRKCGEWTMPANMHNHFFAFVIASVDDVVVVSIFDESMKQYFEYFGCCVSLKRAHRA